MFVNYKNYQLATEGQLVRNARQITGVVISLIYIFLMLLYSICLLFPHISAIVSSSGIVTYSEVKTFLKKEPDMVLENKSITFWNETLTLTGNHLLYARENSFDKFHPMQVCFFIN